MERTFGANRDGGATEAGGAPKGAIFLKIVRRRRSAGQNVPRHFVGGAMSHCICVAKVWLPATDGPPIMKTNAAAVLVLCQDVVSNLMVASFIFAGTSRAEVHVVVDGKWHPEHLWCGTQQLWWPVSRTYSIRHCAGCHIQAWARSRTTALARHNVGTPLRGRLWTQTPQSLALIAQKPLRASACIASSSSSYGVKGQPCLIANDMATFESLTSDVESAW